MKEGTNPQAGPEWPITTKRAWKNRDLKTVYRSNLGYSNHRSPGPASSPRESAQHNERYQYEPPLAQTAEWDWFPTQDSGVGIQDSNFNNVLHPQNRSSMDNSLFPSSYTLAPNQPNASHLMYDGNDSQSPISGQPQMYQDFSWDGASSGNPNMTSGYEDLPMSDLPFRSFGSLEGLSTSDTASSLHSDEFVFPITEPTFGPSGTTDPMTGLALPDEWYQTQALNSTSPGAFDSGSPPLPEDLPLDNEFFQLSNYSYGEVYPGEVAQWPSPSGTLVPQQTPSPQMGHSMTHTINPPIPWNSQDQGNNLQYDATSGVAAFQQHPGPTYTTHVERERFLETGQPIDKTLAPEAVTPAAESDGGSWAIVPSYANSYGSPNSHGSPASHPPSPSRDETEHRRMFSTRVDKTKPKLRGRQRGLTDAEKKQARDVRDAKACWACHISKTKCSPCSAGNPCEQCARLVGKRRFCLFSCYNEPLESLQPFLIPKYLHGHFTKANVEKFVTANATGWGKTSMPVRLNWGYEVPIGVEVVALDLKPNSEMGFHHQAEATNEMISRPKLVRKNSPPLGIQLASVEEMTNEYAQYVHSIVQNNIMRYVPIAYIDQESNLPERLLGVICSYYYATRENDDQSELLRRAIEMHITAVIMERSLVLDSVSQEHVQQQLNQEYPERTAPRCAQRQIKLAFYFLQEKRIMRVLKDWGNMMWSTSNHTPKDIEWATAFSVFLIMILVIDKILGAAWYFCESAIQHDRKDVVWEQRQFQKLVDLTETELFERCKEIFHWKFKTRKGGKEACNPIRDGTEAFQNKSNSAPVDGSVRCLVSDLKGIVGEFENELRAHSSDPTAESKYLDAGRLSCIFFDDFLSH